MGRTHCGIYALALQREQPAISCINCNNLFHLSCANPSPQDTNNLSNNSPWTCATCIAVPPQTPTVDQFKHIIQELKAIKLNQVSSDKTLEVISSSMKSLSDNVSQHGKTMLSLNQKVSTLNANMDTVINDVEKYGDK